jgi:hypothetical protein
MDLSIARLSIDGMLARDMDVELSDVEFTSGAHVHHVARSQELAGCDSTGRSTIKWLIAAVSSGIRGVLEGLVTKEAAGGVRPIVSGHPHVFAAEVLLHVGLQVDRTLRALRAVIDVIVEPVLALAGLVVP